LVSWRAPGQGAGSSHQPGGVAHGEWTLIHSLPGGAGWQVPIPCCGVWTPAGAPPSLGGRPPWDTMPTR